MTLRNTLFRSRSGVGFLAVLAALALGIAIGTVLVLDGVSSTEKEPKSQLKIQGKGKPLVAVNGGMLAEGFTGVAQTVEPAVVNINTTSIVNMERRQRELREFFGDEFWNRFSRGPARRTSLGSGVIVDSQGYILSNHHVIAPVLEQSRIRRLADKISVTLHTGETYTAEVVGVDHESDLAVIKIEAPEPLPYVPVGDASDLRTGEWVLAIGNPFGVGKTITAGIISATARVLLGGPNLGAAFGDYIQTDAAINPGNSGGPLVNMSGEVVGINTLIVSGSRGSQGVGFAIPSTVFINSYNQLVSKGKIERGWMGISMNDRPLNPEMAEYFGVAGEDPDGIKDGDGVLITQLVDERGEPDQTGPAYEAGIREEDVIVKLGNQEVETNFDLRVTVANTPPGDKLPVVVVRRGEVKNFTVVLAERTMEAQERSEAGGLSFEEEEDREERRKEIGLRWRTLNPRDSDQLGLEEAGGVFITEIWPGSLGDEAGLRQFDIITHVNGEPVKTDREFKSTIDGIDSDQAIILRVISINQNRRPSVRFVSFRKP
jgi:serine protease Do